MARMIPPDVHPSCQSPGEIELFHRIRDDPGTADWIVLHSFDVAEHIRQVMGEADFVVIIPAKGVLCLEVKACTKLTREDGYWYYGASVQGDPRGPFKQASAAMHSIRQQINRRRPDLSRMPFWSAVVFPYIAFASSSPEWHDWQVIDAPGLRARPFSASLVSVLDHARALLAEHGASWFHAAGEPSNDQCTDLADLLRPSFEYVESHSVHMQRVEAEIQHYTEEQFEALDAMEQNPRVGFVGPAGSGKTLLALEAVRRSAVEGRRVLFLCYNRLLGNWLQQRVAAMALSGQVVVATMHSHMLKVAGVAPIATSNFWDEELPLLAVMQLLEKELSTHRFDELVLDEAQDLLRSNYLDFLDCSLVGGLAAGRWRLFGDFAKQQIYRTQSISLEQFLRERCGGAPLFRLTANCRNTPSIAAYAQHLGGLHPGYSRILRPDDVVRPVVRYYDSAQQQQAMLVEELTVLHEQGFRGKDIAVLSTRQDVASCAASVKASPWADRLKPMEQAGRGYTGFCSIHAFKGLEAQALILTDLDQVQTEAAQDLLYVGITRAQSRLVIVAHSSVRRQIVQILTGGNVEDRGK